MKIEVLSQVPLFFPFLPTPYQLLQIHLLNKSQFFIFSFSTVSPEIFKFSSPPLSSIVRIYSLIPHPLVFFIFQKYIILYSSVFLKCYLSTKDS